MISDYHCHPIWKMKCWEKRSVSFTGWSVLIQTDRHCSGSNRVFFSPPYQLSSAFKTPEQQTKQKKIKNSIYMWLFLFSFNSIVYLLLHLYIFSFNFRYFRYLYLYSKTALLSTNLINITRKYYYFQNMLLYRYIIP